ncbi:hypothetical protein EJB05_48898, partial [Eragrostis curvula]
MPWSGDNTKSVPHGLHLKVWQQAATFPLTVGKIRKCQCHLRGLLIGQAWPAMFQDCTKVQTSVQEER